MYAIIEDSGKQFKVSEGDHLLVDVRDLAEGQSELTFDKVLMLGEGAGSKLGTPYVTGASVGAKIVSAIKMPRVTGIKFRRRKGYRNKFGHRQPMLRVEITSING